MLCSDKAPDKMFYGYFILILTSPLSSGCCYSIFFFHLILGKQGKLLLFFLSELKRILCRVERLADDLPWEIRFCG